ncbi:MAG: CpsB/CapC family capsule biosynthesis tyrosine phosphatase, partial [Bacteroidota bacterium]
MFSFFRRQKQVDQDYSFLGVDMHSHLIPGIDDGAKTMEDSVLLIRRLVDMGYRKIITTPHIMQEFFPNTPIVIRKGLEKVKAALQAEGIQVELEAAAEYFVDESFEALL